ncbi:MAG: hypothetical protein RL095_1314 [Verrucomicrobiota bacterium]|jgi:hypothetical protein
MNLLQIIALVVFFVGMGLWLSSRKKKPQTPDVPAAAALLLSLILGVISAFIPNSEVVDTRYVRVNQAQWEYPLQQLCAKIGNSGKICVIVPPETESGSDVEFLKPYMHPGCTLEVCHVPKTGVSSSFIQAVLVKNPKAVILAVPLPNGDEARADLAAYLTEHPIKVPMLFTPQARQDALLLFAASSLWGYVECKAKPAVAELNENAALEEVFKAAYVLYDENNRPSDMPQSHPVNSGHRKTPQDHPIETETEE